MSVHKHAYGVTPAGFSPLYLLLQLFQMVDQSSFLLIYLAFALNLCGTDKFVDLISFSYYYFFMTVALLHRCTTLASFSCE